MNPTNAPRMVNHLNWYIRMVRKIRRKIHYKWTSIETANRVVEYPDPEYSRQEQEESLPTSSSYMLSSTVQFWSSSPSLESLSLYISQKMISFTIIGPEQLRGPMTSSSDEPMMCYTSMNSNHQEHFTIGPRDLLPGFSKIGITIFERDT